MTVHDKFECNQSYLKVKINTTLLGGGGGGGGGGESYCSFCYTDPIFLGHTVGFFY
jgi:hypothetical protein